MKVLIVNGFKPDTKGSKKFKNFVNTVKGGFLKHKYTIAGSFSIITRDPKNIDDYLESQMFDTLDFVFIDGDSNYLPWNKNCTKIYELFKL